MSSEFGNLLHVSVFGQSHGRAIGVVVDGLPAGEAIDLAELQAFLDRRRPGKSFDVSAHRKKGIIRLRSITCVKIYGTRRVFITRSIWSCLTW